MSCDIPRTAPFNGFGWRRKQEVGCFAPCPKPRPEYHSGSPGVALTYPWQCERKKGHKGWHCCDNASWPQESQP